MKNNDIVLSDKYIERLHPDFYKVFFGYYAVTSYSAESQAYFHPLVYRYIKKSDIQKSPEFYDALIKYQKTIEGKKILSSLSPADNLIFSNKLMFVPTFWNTNLTALAEVKAACKDMLEIAKKQKIGFYKKSELRKVEMQDFQFEK